MKVDTKQMMKGIKAATKADVPKKKTAAPKKAVKNSSSSIMLDTLVEAGKKRLTKAKAPKKTKAQKQAKLKDSFTEEQIEEGFLLLEDSIANSKQAALATGCSLEATGEGVGCNGEVIVNSNEAPGALVTINQTVGLNFEPVDDNDFDINEASWETTETEKIASRLVAPVNIGRNVIALNVPKGMTGETLKSVVDKFKGDDTLANKLTKIVTTKRDQKAIDKAKKAQDKIDAKALRIQKAADKANGVKPVAAPKAPKAAKATKGKGVTPIATDEPKGEKIQAILTLYKAGKTPAEIVALGHNKFTVRRQVYEHRQREAAKKLSTTFSY